MTVRDKDGRMGLATCSVEDLKSCSFVIGTDDSDVRDFHWINNQRLVFRMGDVQEQDIRLDGTWFAANSDGSELLPLIDNKRFIATVGSVVKNHILDYTYSFLSVTHHRRSWHVHAYRLFALECSADAAQYQDQSAGAVRLS